MADLTHDPAEDGFHEIQLSGKQVVFLAMTTTAVLVAVFLTGIMVGRGVSAEQQNELSDGPVAISPAGAEQVRVPPAEPPSVPPEDELSYHGRLQGSGAPEPASPAAEPPEPAPAAAPQPAPEPEATGVPTSGNPGTWVVQVTALQNRTAAAGIVERLIAKGYPAYLEMPARGAPAIYRVRIGRYAARGEAEQVARRLEKEEQHKPVVTR